MKPQDFLREVNRMCCSFETIEDKDGGISCKGCPLSGNFCAADLDINPDYFAMMYDTVEAWSDTHPIEARQDRLLKLFPHAKMLTVERQKAKVIDVCPNTINCNTIDTNKCARTLCINCKADYWLAPIDKDEVEACEHYE